MFSVFQKMILAVCLVGLATPAHAYIDPGTGSAIVAALVGVFAAAYAYVKHFWHRLIRFFSPNEQKKQQANNTNEAEER